MAPDGRRWRRLSPNGNNVGSGGQGYSRTIDVVTQIVRTQKPPYVLRNLITGNERIVLDDGGAQETAEEALVQAGEEDELDMPERPAEPATAATGPAPVACMTFDALGDNLMSCANCHQPFWLHTHRATTYGNQRIPEDEKRAARELAEKNGMI